MRLWSTLERGPVEIPPPGEKKTVGMYVCGPTVYDYIHIGNARPLIVFDALRRYLESRGYEIVYVVNITDIDDKIINRAAEEGSSPEEIAERFTREYLEDLGALGAKPPTYQPRARAYVDKMIELIGELVAKGNAYVADGDVYFAVRSFPGYGKLSGKDLDDLRAGSRVEPEEKKRDPLDFALWKAAKPGEPRWPSPWGPGRPGWHTECVVMARELLGETLDIHAGGSDLVFPHHENEIAQAEAVSGKPFARIWLHNGMLTVRGEKMAKSLGNFAYARDVVRLFGTEAVRYFYLSRHWRKPLDFSPEALEEARKAVEGVYRFLAEAELAAEGNENAALPEKLAGELKLREEKFHEELEDDFNTPGALAALQGMVNAGKRFAAEEGDRRALRAIAGKVRELAAPLGLFQEERAPSLSGKTEELIGLLVELRNGLRREGNFQLADRIREKLSALGIELKDTPHGTIWTLK